MFEYESFPRSRSRPASTIAPWSKAICGRSSTGCQRRVVRNVWVDPERDEPEVGGRELPRVRVAVRVAVGRRAARGARPRGRRPSRPDAAGSTPRASRPGRAAPPGSAHAPAKGSRAALPEQHLQRAVAHLEHDREGDCIGLVDSPRFTTHRLKLAKGTDDEEESRRRSSRSAVARARRSPRLRGAVTRRGRRRARRPRRR